MKTSVTRGEARHAQHAQRVFGEGRRHVAQQSGLQITLATVGVDQLPLLVFGNGIDGEVASLQILLEGDLGAGMEGEAAITAAALALGTRQGVLLAALRMQEHRKVCAHRAKAPGLHYLRGGADHHPVHFTDRAPQQAITHRAADFVDLHNHLRRRGG